MEVYPLVNIQKAMENHHAINGKIHYFDWAIFNCKLLVHQRVMDWGSFEIHWMCQIEIENPQNLLK